MLPAEIEKPLSLIEMQCEAVALAVASGEPQALETASQSLRDAAVEFAGLLERLGGVGSLSHDLRARLRKLSGLMTIQRENLIRRNVVVERALHAMVPEMGKAAAMAAGGAFGSGRGAASYRGLVS